MRHRGSGGKRSVRGGSVSVLEGEETTNIILVNASWTHICVFACRKLEQGMQLVFWTMLALVCFRPYQEKRSK